jgi:MoaA/NifB/PqqE/SkfB family radical SAM enzyme
VKTTDRVHELFLNYACNAKCPFCYNPPLTPELLRLDLSYEQAAESLYKASKTGAKRLNLHGGEVTLRDDLPKILALARKVGFREITVVTNGIRFSDAGYAKELKAAGATHLRFSIHAANAAIHDAIVAIPGAFARVLKGIEAVRAAGLPLGANFVLIKKNLAELPPFVDKFCVELGIEDSIVYFPHLRGMMELNAGAEGIRYEDAAPHVREAFKRLGRAGKRDSVLLANFTPCVLPELADRMIDWSHGEGGETAQTHPEGFTEDILEMKDDQRILVGACRSCTLKDSCLGVEREYLARWGESSFKSLAAEQLCPDTVGQGHGRGKR